MLKSYVKKKTLHMTSNPPDAPQPHARLAQYPGVDAHGPFGIEIAQGLRCGVHLVVMGRAGELRQFRDILPRPRAMLRVREQDVSGLEERGHGMGAGRLAAVRLHGDDAGHGVFQRVDDRRAVGLVLHQFAGCSGPFGGKRPERSDRVRKPHTPPDLIEEVTVGPLAAPHLPNNKIGIVAVLERHVPRDKKLVEPLRQVFGKPEAQPFGLENVAPVGRRPLLVQGLPVACAEGFLDGKELAQRVAFRVQGFPGLAVGLEVFAVTGELVDEVIRRVGGLEGPRRLC